MHRLWPDIKVKLSVILSDAETTKLRRDSGDLEPFMLNTTH